MMNLAQTALAATKGMLAPTHPLTAKWEILKAPPLPRSSHTLSVVNGRAYIFGGEISPRQPVDNDMHVVVLPSSTVAEADYKVVPAGAAVAVGVNGGDTAAPGEVPQKRVGHSAAVIGERIFIFGGRGGRDMAPLEEGGRIWVFDTRSERWSSLDPVPDTPFPAARSYHASVAVEKPGPPVTARKHDSLTGETIAGSVASVARDVQAEDEGYGTLFIHAGCPATGRLNDLWGFDVRSRTWKQFPSAPGPPRGGPSLAISKSRIYRFGGFNGLSEEGGQVDFLDLVVDTLAGGGEGMTAGEEEIALSSSKAGWESIVYNSSKEGTKVPGNRSVAGLHPITTGMGREYLILLLGERDPSADGHAGAGTFWDDVWAFQVPPEGMTGASFKDATWQSWGKDTGEGEWSEVYVADAEGREEDDARGLTPGGRGWFASASAGEVDPGAVVVWGGLNGRNEREGEGWILRFE
jgi:hypothetical protein